MNVLAQRFLFGTLLLVGVFFVLWLDQHFESTLGFLALCLVFLGGAWIEYARIAELHERVDRAISLVVVLGVVALEWWFLNHAAGSSWAPWHLVALGVLPFLLPAVLLVLSFREEPSRRRFHDLGMWAFGVAYLVYPLVAFLRLRELEHGLAWTALVILLVKGNDIGAFLVGRKLGRTPLSPISPKKTWEGAVGGLLLGVGVALAFQGWGGFLGWGGAALVGVAGGIAGQVGDLAESYLKRAFGVKDSAALVPAFGGALDIVDSLLFGAPLLYVLRVWLG